MASASRRARPSPPPRSPSRPPALLTPRRERLLLTLAAALVPLVVYWPILAHGFLLDDFVLFQTSASLSDPASIGRGFVMDVGALRKGTETVISSYYRPVFLALSTIYHGLAGGSTAAWHAASVVLASALSALAVGFFVRMGLAPAVAAVAAVAWSLHPSHVSSVAWASGLQELLAALFALLALRAALWRTEQEGGGAVLPVALAALYFALGLLSKEVVLGLLPLVGIWSLAVAPDDAARARRLRQVTVVFALVTALYLTARIAVLGALASPPPNAPGLHSALLSVPVALAAYLRILLWPVGFSFFRPERPVVDALDPALLVSIVALAVLAWLATWAIRRDRRLLLPLAWLLVWLAPVLNLWALDPQWMVTDRYLFLPSLALPWILAIVVPREKALAVLGAVAIVCGALTLRYSAIFAGEMTFVRAMEEAEPTSATILGEKGRLLLRQGDRSGARQAFERAVELDPVGPGPLIALADLEVAERQFAAAETHYRQALVTRPYASRGFKLLALGLIQNGQRARAFTLIEESAKRWPDDFELRLLEALALSSTGDRASAETAFEAARRLRPQDPAVAGGFDEAVARLQVTVQPQKP